MFTRRGRVLLVEGVLLYVLARGISVGELYALALAAIVFPLLGVAFVRWGRHRVGFTRASSPRRLFAGSQVRLEYQIRNLGRLPSPPLILDDPAPSAIGGAVHVALPSLSPGRSGSIAVERAVPARGVYRLGPLSARLVDPFGLAQVSSTVAGDARVVVYPRIEVLHEAAAPEARGATSGSVLHRLATAGDEFYAVRDWQHGDDLRKVHWRTTARRAQLQIRQDEVPPFPRATVFIDTRASARPSPGGDVALEWAISAAASLVWELGRQGFALRLGTADAGPGHARWGREAMDPLLTTLAGASGSRAPTLAAAARRTAARVGAGGLLIAILPPGDADSTNAIARARPAYAWAGAVLLDAASFSPGSTRERAQYDQRLADSEHALARAGWRVVVAGGNDRFPNVWQTLLAAGGSRRSSRSLRS